MAANQTHWGCNSIKVRIRLSVPVRTAELALPGRTLKGCGSKSACAGLDSLQMRRLWRRGALQGQRPPRGEGATRSGRRWGQVTVRYDLP